MSTSSIDTVGAFFMALMSSIFHPAPVDRADSVAAEFAALCSPNLPDIAATTQRATERRLVVFQDDPQPRAGALQSWTVPLAGRDAILRVSAVDRPGLHRRDCSLADPASTPTALLEAYGRRTAMTAEPDTTGSTTAPTRTVTALATNDGGAALIASERTERVSRIGADRVP